MIGICFKEKEEENIPIVNKWKYEFIGFRAILEKYEDRPERIYAIVNKMMSAIKGLVDFLKLKEPEDVIDELENIVDEMELIGEPDDPQEAVEQFDYVLETFYDFADTYRIALI